MEKLTPFSVGVAMLLWIAAVSCMPTIGISANGGHLLSATVGQDGGQLVKASENVYSGPSSVLQRPGHSQVCSCQTDVQLQLPRVPVFDGVHTTTATRMMFHINVHQASVASGSCAAAAPQGEVILHYTQTAGEVTGAVEAPPAKQLLPSYNVSTAYARIPLMRLLPGSYSVSASFLPAGGSGHCASQSRCGLPLHILPPAQTAVSWEPFTNGTSQGARIFVRIAGDSNPAEAEAPRGRVLAVLRLSTDPSRTLKRMLDLAPVNASAASAEFRYDSLGAAAGVHDLTVSFTPEDPTKFTSAEADDSAAITVRRNGRPVTKEPGMPANHEGFDYSLGRTYHLAGINFLESANNLFGGRALWGQGYEECVRSDSAADGSKIEKYIDSYSSFLQYAKSSLNVDASTTELQITANASFEWVNSGTENNTLYVLQVVYTSTKYYIDEDCIYEINPGLNRELIGDLQRLPEPPTDPAAEWRWNAYIDFLNKWGTQWVARYDSGATFSQWVRSSASNGLTEANMKAAACLKMLGPEGTGKQGACADVSAGEREAASLYDFSAETAAFGGTKELLDKVLLENPVNLDDLNNFLNSAQEAEAPAVYFWKSTLQTIKEQVGGVPEYYSKAYALQQFYEGFQGYGCQETMTDRRFTLQYFKYIATEYSEVGNLNLYACMQRCIGCHDDDDCHNSGAHGWCYGPSCIIHAPTTRKAVVNLDRKLNDYDLPPNEACHWHAGGGRCNQDENTLFYCSGPDDQFQRTWWYTGP